MLVDLDRILFLQIDLRHLVVLFAAKRCRFAGEAELFLRYSSYLAIFLDFAGTWPEELRDLLIESDRPVLGVVDVDLLAFVLLHIHLLRCLELGVLHVEDLLLLDEVVADDVVDDRHVEVAVALRRVGHRHW